MASGAPKGLDGLVNDILDWIFSPAGRIALIVLAVALVMRAFRLRRRGKKPARDAAWLKGRLRNAGFGKWVYLDLVIYLALAGALGLGAYHALAVANLAIAPSGYAYLFRPDPDWVMVSALFMAIALPGFLWRPVGRLIHGRRFRKYVLYMIAHYNADTRPFVTWGCTSILILSVVFSVQMSRAHFGLVRTDAGLMLDQQGVFALRPQRYDIGNATAVYFVSKRRAPNGNIVNRPYIAVTFAGGRAWTSAWWLGGPKADRLVDLARQLAGQAGLAIVPREFFGEDDYGDKSPGRS